MAGILRAEIGAQSYKSVDSLEAALKKTWKEIQPETVRASCNTDVMENLGLCISTPGGLFGL
ncbi:hypothetical protein ANCDUO_11659 [Ancylostoma duodenale]|uniref:Uncharacterized protein n=1 Tax=Ancylostoma duodenale TaxID=51022 RepID=A0A0C2GM50_9BILA|nr:hypothetical protein ANCDUO_11659 [Ancylostoma duodenale]